MFPWEIDAQPEMTKRHAKNGYKKRVAGVRNKSKNNYKKFGHPKWYGEYLKSPHWVKFRERYKRSRKTVKCCLICKTKRYELHHITYERIGKERFADVVPLCRKHHALAHKREKEGAPLATSYLPSEKFAPTSAKQLS